MPPWLQVILPFLVAGLVSLVPTAVELLAISGRYFGRTLRSRPGLSIVALNVGAAVVTFTLLKYLFGISNDLVTALLVGLGFPTLLRNPLVFAKVPEERDELRLIGLRQINELYEGLLRQAVREVAVALSDYVYRRVRGLLEQYSADSAERELLRELDTRIRLLPDLDYRRELTDLVERYRQIPDAQTRLHMLATVLLRLRPRE